LRLRPRRSQVWRREALVNEPAASVMSVASADPSPALGGLVPDLCPLVPDPATSPAYREGVSDDAGKIIDLFY